MVWALRNLASKPGAHPGGLGLAPYVDMKGLFKGTKTILKGELCNFFFLQAFKQRHRAFDTRNGSLHAL